MRIPGARRTACVDSLPYRVRSVSIKIEPLWDNKTLIGWSDLRSTDGFVFVDPDPTEPLKNRPDSESVSSVTAALLAMPEQPIPNAEPRLLGHLSDCYEARRPRLPQSSLQLPGK